MIRFLFLLLLSPLLYAGDFFSSDGLARHGDPVEGPLAAPWVLETEGNETILYKEGELYKRWVRSRFTEEGQSLTREDYFFGQQLRTQSIRNAAGRLVRESLYDSTGNFLVENRFHYDGEKLERIDQLNDSGLIIETRRLQYRSDGSLRSLKGDGDGRIDWRAADFNESYLDTLYLEDGPDSRRFDYKGGRVKRYSEYNENELTGQTEYYYGSDGKTEKEIFYDYPANSRRVSYFNEEGSLSIQNLYINENLVKAEIFSYNEGRLIRRQEQTTESRHSWEYEYIAGEEDPFLTREYINGSLVKESEVIEEGTRETLYRRGEAVLTRIRENTP